MPRARAAILVLALGMALGACAEKADRAAGEPAAFVDRHAIGVAEVEQALQQRALRPEQAQAVARQVLERLIDQQLAAVKAQAIGLDDDPRVVQALDAARREVLARAYLDKVGESAPRPTADEVRRYYDERPALFSQRRVFSLQELVIEARAEQVAQLRERLGSARSIGEYAEWLRASGLRFGANQAVRSAEQLPAAGLAAIAGLADGQAALVPTPTGATVLVRSGSREQPLTLEQARPAIEQQILAERRRRLAEADLGALRAAAKIEYAGRFAAGPAPAASAPR